MIEQDRLQRALAALIAAVTELAAALAETSRGGLASLDAVEPLQDQPDMKLVLTPAEFAAMIGVHPRTVQRMRAAGQGPKAICVRGAVRYRCRDVERWLEGKRR